MQKILTTLFFLVFIITGCAPPPHIEPTGSSFAYLDIPCRPLGILLNGNQINSDCDKTTRVPIGTHNLRISFYENTYTGVGSISQSGTIDLEVTFKRNNYYRLMAKIDKVSGYWRTWVFNTNTEEEVSRVIETTE